MKLKKEFIEKLKAAYAVSFMELVRELASINANLPGIIEEQIEDKQP